MVVVSFAVFFGFVHLDSRGDGARRQRAANQLAVLQKNQRLGGSARGQIKVVLVCLGRLDEPLCVGGTGRQDGFDAVCADHIAEPNVDKSLWGLYHEHAPFRGFDPSAYMRCIFGQNFQVNFEVFVVWRNK